VEKNAQITKTTAPIVSIFISQLVSLRNPYKLVNSRE